jgi:hypothetical protein
MVAMQVDAHGLHPTARPAALRAWALEWWGRAPARRPRLKLHRASQATLKRTLTGGRTIGSGRASHDQHGS